jgi:hypothetical protein
LQAAVSVALNVLPVQLLCGTALVKLPSLAVAGQIIKKLCGEDIMQKLYKCGLPRFPFRLLHVCTGGQAVQRCSKFVFIENYYPRTRKIMLYNLQVEQKEKPTETYIFGTRLLLTLGVEILGKKLDKNIFATFKTIDEIIDFKANMRKTPQEMCRFY